MQYVPMVSDLDAILGTFLQIRNNRKIPEVDKPRSELIHSDGTGQEKAGT